MDRKSLTLELQFSAKFRLCVCKWNNSSCKITIDFSVSIIVITFT